MQSKTNKIELLLIGGLAIVACQGLSSQGTNKITIILGNVLIVRDWPHLFHVSSNLK